ncbi:hypothetical protein [Micromonospora sp. WMMD964]|uniref:hypothetical protein n=1 Tax=Micromonospora sp. WMMD964 TaxID=3016091 RepID=UPI00249CD99F|nr:hypothetical protein [Micromonospora sp. WMMD964]WFF02793.1 hypothetical protein O7616_08575 [Micromonospora sp. WMMD964]
MLPVEVAARRPPLDYYLVLPRRWRTESTDVVAEGIVVEEFTRRHDFSTAGLGSAGWSPEAGGPGPFPS